MPGSRLRSVDAGTHYRGLGNIVAQGATVIKVPPSARNEQPHAINVFAVGIFEFNEAIAELVE